MGPRAKNWLRSQDSSFEPMRLRILLILNDSTPEHPSATDYPVYQLVYHSNSNLGIVNRSGGGSQAERTSAVPRQVRSGRPHAISRC